MSFASLCDSSLSRWFTRMSAGVAMSALSAVVAQAAEPIGIWLVANGYAHVKIEPCNGAYYGVIDWNARPGDVDKHNPDLAKRGRPVLGMAILLAMKQTKDNEWSGEVYNAENGKTYDASITLVEPDVLRITGCVLGFLCGGENWTRVKEDANPDAAKNAAPANAAKSTAPKSAAPANAAKTPPANNTTKKPATVARGGKPAPAPVTESCPS